MAAARLFSIDGFYDSIDLLIDSDELPPTSIELADEIEAFQDGDFTELNNVLVYFENALAIYENQMQADDYGNDEIYDAFQTVIYGLRNPERAFPISDEQREELREILRRRRAPARNGRKLLTEKRPRTGGRTKKSKIKKSKKSRKSNTKKSKSKSKK